MEHNIRTGLLISFIFSGGAFMISPFQYVGIAILAIATVWAYLFVLPFSPVKRRWWYISDKLVIVNMQYAGQEAKANAKYITVFTELRPRSSIRVDKIAIEIKRKKIPSFHWQSHNVAVDEQILVNFERPDWLYTGEYEAKLIAFTPEGRSKSGKFTVEVND